MATNTGKGHREGSVTGRTQIKTPVTENFTKRDADSGKFMAQKDGGKPFKGVAKEVDHRRR